MARGAADMVLADDNFATIVTAVKEGRGIYDNIRKAVHFLLSSNIGEIITIFVAILLGWNTPLLPVQLLWINLITDSFPAIALGVDPGGVYHGLGTGALEAAGLGRGDAGCGRGPAALEGGKGRGSQKNGKSGSKYGTHDYTPIMRRCRCLCFPLINPQ